MLRHHLVSAIGAITLSFALMSNTAGHADILSQGADVLQASQDDSASSLQHELDAFPRARITVCDGIALVEKRIAGSKVVDISFDGRKGRLIYHVKSVHNGKIWKGRIDAETGDIIDSGNSTPLDRFPSGDRRNIADLDAAKISLSDAVAIAETYGSGKAISAGLNESNGHFVLLIVVVSDGQLKAVSIDPSNAPTAANTLRNLQPNSAH